MPTVRLELSIGLEARRLSSLHKKTCPAAGYGAWCCSHSDSLLDSQKHLQILTQNICHSHLFGVRVQLVQNPFWGLPCIALCCNPHEPWCRWNIVA